MSSDVGLTHQGQTVTLAVSGESVFKLFRDSALRKTVKQLFPEMASSLSRKSLKRFLVQKRQAGWKGVLERRGSGPGSGAAAAWARYVRYR